MRALPGGLAGALGAAGLEGAAVGLCGGGGLAGGPGLWGGAGLPACGAWEHTNNDCYPKSCTKF